RALTVDLTAFQIPWDNMQVQTVWNGTFPAINNIGSAEVRGAELGFKTLLPWNFTLMINATYAVSKTEESFDSSEGFIEKGTILPLAPRWTGSTVLSWNDQWGNFALNGSLGASYQGDSKNNFGNTLPIDALTTYSASFGIIGVKWRYAPTLNFSITNLTNERAMLAGVVSRDETANSDIYVPAQPRTISISAGISF
ncbi:TonB-dependent receptor domain-containing protein, partial [Litorivivens sp.]|uniref:TonB-dependent receptor domain-containing protein n=1 Tax=Litorivivens sp. TaxID=2020868 RepID=UPI003562D574